MKHVKRVAIFLLILSMSFPLFTFADTSLPGKPAKGDMRGLWVASVLNIDYPTKPTTDSVKLRIEALMALDYAVEMGFNAVFLQVRPTADALYKSKYFPWSRYLTGEQGLAPADDFDPLEYWVEQAHKRGLELHAWINPYRITKRSTGEPTDPYALLSPESPAVKRRDLVVKGSDGNLYFDPGKPEARQLIVLGIAEIIENYDVDGIHFDDYFYPDENFNDKATYDRYKKPGMSIGDWRRENVNILVRDVHKIIRLSKKNISFGISPFGIWANKSSNPRGSDTQGLQSYSAHFADSLQWIKEGIIDYIAPQLYWNIGYSIADYSKLLSWWSNAVAGSGVDLYIGQAAYRAGSTDPSSAWYGTAEIERQLKLNAANPEVDGSIFYNYSSLINNPALSEVVKAIYKQRDQGAASLPVSISRPSGNITTRFSQFYLNGASDPSKPLYLNGELVENRSPKGYFGILMPLSAGANTFVFSQEGSYSTVSIYRDVSTAAPVKMSKAEIPASSVFPQAPEARMPGEKITLSCKAPIGAKVTVKLNGKSYTMTPATKTVSGSGIYETTYTYGYTMPSFTGTPRNVDLGTPEYRMEYKGVTMSRKAPAGVTVIMKGSPYYAEITEDMTDTYNEPVSGNGTAYHLTKGMVDAVTGMTGSYARLSSGQWVFKSRVKIFSLKTALQPTISKAEYIAGDKWDTLKLDISAPSSAIASFDGTTLRINVSAVANASQPVLPGGSPFSSVKVTNDGGTARYALTMKQNMKIDGYYVETSPTGLSVKIKRHVVSGSETTPLSGITIMLDPGHGGTESGALGPLGLSYAEKDINLQLSLKLKANLEALGANVLITRSTDKTVSLAERLRMSWNAKPDMFISVHSNAMEDNVDISKIEGFSVWYREGWEKSISQLVYDRITGLLGRGKKGVHTCNFYVMTGTWTPSFLIETGFVPNPTEFEWLTDDVSQSQLAKSLSDAIAACFAQ